MQGKVYELNDTQRAVLAEIQQSRAVIEASLRTLAWSVGVPKEVDFQVVPDLSGFLVLPKKETPK